MHAHTHTHSYKKTTQVKQSSSLATAAVPSRHQAWTESLPGLEAEQSVILVHGPDVCGSLVLLLSMGARHERESLKFHIFTIYLMAAA